MGEYETDRDTSLNRHELRLRLLKNGYQPLPLDGKRCLIKGWSILTIDEAWLAPYRRQARFGNTGIRTGEVVAVDLDIRDPHLCEALKDVVEQILGPTEFWRVGEAPKLLGCFRNGQPARKRRTSLWSDGQLEHCVEVLGRGAQFAAYGIHPGTGKPYQWIGGMEPLTHDVANLPVVTTEQIDAFIEACEELFAEASLQKISRLGPTRESSYEYCLKPDTRFEIVKPVSGIYTVEELKQAISPGQHWMCNLGPDIRPTSDSGAGMAGWSKDGQRFHVHDFVEDVTYLESMEIDPAFRQVMDDCGLLPPSPETYHERLMGAHGMLPKIGRSGLPDAKLTKDGHPTATQATTIANLSRIFDSVRISVRLNMMNRMVQPAFLNNVLREYTPDNEALAADFVRDLLWGVCLRAGMSDRTAFERALSQYGEAERYHPMEDWITAAIWDGEDRFETLQASVAVLPEYAKIWAIFLRRWLIQCVEAARGWRRENLLQKAGVLILAGPQNVGKTTWFASLVPPKFFKEGVGLNFSGGGWKDSVMVATRWPIVELGELETTFRRSDVGALKAFLSNCVDSYRQPYAHRVTDWPRCTSFCGTVNSAQFMLDETGSRRYWPVEVTSCDPFHGIDLGQLWAQVNTWGRQASSAALHAMRRR